MGIWSRLRVHRHSVVHLTRSVSNTLEIKYDILNTVSNTKEFQYGILNTVSNTKEILYSIKNLVSNTLELNYNLNGVVSNTLELLYSVIAGTVSGTASKSSGQKLKTIDEPDRPRHFKKPIVSVTGFHMRAKLRHEQEAGFQTSARLVQVQHSDSFRMKSSKFASVQFVGMVTSRLKIEQHIPIKTESKLKTAQYVGKMESQISYYPALVILRKNVESILGIKTRQFTFSEATNTPPVGTPQDQDRERTFKEPSSFVGKVTYNIDDQTMEVVLNGKTYNHCRVPERIFDAFMGADSKGRYYNRIIKKQYSC